MSDSTRIPGRRMLHSPGPTPVPDAVLDAMSGQPMDLAEPRVSANIDACEHGLRRLLCTRDAKVFFYASNGHGVWEAVVENLLPVGGTALVPGTGHFSESWAVQTDLSPVARMALDEFILWVNAETPYSTASDYVAAAKKAGPSKMKMGGTGSKQEDQIITVAVEKQTGMKLIYIPFKGGGDVAVQLVGKHIDSSVNNPIEAVAQWRAGKLRPLCVFDSQRMPYTAKITDKQAWSDIPTCKQTGIDVSYVVLRGVFMPPGVTSEQVKFYVDLFGKVRQTAEWKEFMEKGMTQPIPTRRELPGTTRPSALTGPLRTSKIDP